MLVEDRGYIFTTSHTDEGAKAHVSGHYKRFQTQAPIKPGQGFELEFYGKGAGMVLEVKAIPRIAVPAAMARALRPRTNERHEEISNNKSQAVSSRSPSSTSINSITRIVNTDFDSPFDRDWMDWELEPVPLPPDVPPGGGGDWGGGGGGGGGSGGTNQAAVQIRLFVFGTSEPVETWNLPAVTNAPTLRSVTYEPEGFPTEDSPVWRTTWWRMVVTPLDPDPVNIEIHARVTIGDVPIRTTPISMRLADHIFRVALEALVPQAKIEGNKFSLSIGPEVAEMAGVPQEIAESDISPAAIYNTRLRSVDITTVSGEQLHTMVMNHYRDKVRASIYGEVAESFDELDDEAVDEAVNIQFSEGIERLTLVEPDDVCIRIQAAFTDAPVSVWGFDVGTLNGELGEFFLAFDHSIKNMRPFCFLDVDLNAAVEILKGAAEIFKHIPDANERIETKLRKYETQVSICTYMAAFLAHAVAQNAIVHDFKIQNNAWQIRHSEDPVIPPPTQHLPPGNDSGAVEDDPGIIGLIARHNAALSLETADRVAKTVKTESSDSEGAERVLPSGFLTEDDHLARLDQHQSIVVVMMENRSYDHMLGDLINARPSSTDPYDGPASNAYNPAVGGFLHGVPLVHSRDLKLGTAIPVSPRHSYDAVQFQIGNGTQEGLSTGDMLGFARDIYNRTDSPQIALTVYGEEELSVHYKLADEFLTCDRWFAAHPGPTQPNRFATMSGSIFDLDNFENDDPRMGFLKNRIVFDALSEAGVDWRVFESDLSMIRMFDLYRLNDSNVVPINDTVDGLEATLRKIGPLPRVMFIEPNFTDIPPLKTADDDHPPADLANGQKFLSRVCDLLWDTDRFGEVLLVITYDEHGGFFDHVPPPGTPKGGSIPYPPLIDNGPTWLGVRVPTFIVSPFVSAKSINKTIFDHTAILKTILVHNRAKLKPDVLLSFGERVNTSKDLSTVLDLPTPRQAPVAFIRRPPERARKPIFGSRVTLQSALEATQSFYSQTSAPAEGLTPREVFVTPRVDPPRRRREEPRDFHTGLIKLFKPRKV